MSFPKGQPLVLATVILLYSLSGGKTFASNWEHQSSPWQSGGQPISDPGWALNYPNGMAWVLGPDSTTIRSPVDTPQPTGLSWSIVPGGVGDSFTAGRYTQPITALGASGLSEFADYQALLGGVIDEWASVCGITNLGFVEEDGSVLVGGIVDTDGDGVYITDRGPAAGVGHIRFMAFDSNWMNVSASATYIPEPGSGVDNASNHRKSGDVRFKADHFIWGQEGQDPDTLNFRNIALHEVGHVLGFGHNNIPGSVMNVGYEWNLGAGDIEGAVAIYGPVGGTTVVVNCDFNDSGTCDDTDIDLLADAVRNGISGSQFNVDGLGDPNIPDNADFNFYIIDNAMIGTGHGDADLNKTVNFADFVSLSNNFGMTDTGWATGNFNTDTITNFNDFVAMSNNFGMNFASGSNVPEPTILSVLGLGGLALIRRCRNG